MLKRRHLAANLARRISSPLIADSVPGNPTPNGSSAAEQPRAPEAQRERASASAGRTPEGAGPASSAHLASRPARALPRPKLSAAPSNAGRRSAGWRWCRVAPSAAISSSPRADARGDGLGGARERSATRSGDHREAAISPEIAHRRAVIGRCLINKQQRQREAPHNGDGQRREAGEECQCAENELRQYRNVIDNDGKSKYAMTAAAAGKRK